MAVASLNTVFGLGKQTGLGTAKTALNTFRMTDLSNTPDITVDDLLDEFGAGAAIIPGSGGVRLGVYSRVNGGGRLRPDHLYDLLAAAGYSVAGTTGAPSEYTHAITKAATNAAFPFYSALVQMGPSGSVLDRLISDLRFSRLRLNLDRNSVARFEFEAMGLHEENAAGSETTTDETGPVLRTVEGTFTLTKEGGGAVVASARAVTLEIENDFITPNDDMILGDHEAQSLTWLGQRITGTIDAALSEAAWQELFYGGSGSAGAGYSFTDLQAGLVVRVESAGLISTVPYSLSIAIPNLIARGGEVRASGRSEVRMPITFQAYDDGVDEFCTFTLINDTASY